MRGRENRSRRRRSARRGGRRAPRRRARSSGAAAPAAARARAARDDLGRHQCEEEPADERNRRRHRQAVREAEQHDEKREGAVAQHDQDVADGQTVARLRGKREPERGRARCGGQGTQSGSRNRADPVPEKRRPAKAAGVTPCRTPARVSSARRPPRKPVAVSPAMAVSAASARRRRSGIRRA